MANITINFQVSLSTKMIYILVCYQSIQIMIKIPSKINSTISLKEMQIIMVIFISSRDLNNLSSLRLILEFVMLILQNKRGLQQLKKETLEIQEKGVVIWKLQIKWVIKQQLKIITIMCWIQLRRQILQGQLILWLQMILKNHKLSKCEKKFFKQDYSIVKFNSTHNLIYKTAKLLLVSIKITMASKISCRILFMRILHNQVSKRYKTSIRTHRRILINSSSESHMSLLMNATFMPNLLPPCSFQTSVSSFSKDIINWTISPYRDNLSSILRLKNSRMTNFIKKVKLDPLIGLISINSPL